MSSMTNWDKLRTPPPEAMKKIEGGRLRGKTDISPQWRYKVMTEVFGQCGIGWKWEVVERWTAPGPKDQVFAFINIKLYVKDGDKWSEPIPGTGGSMLIEIEKDGLHANDEAFKMATTDALGTAMKMIGVGADVYAGLFDGKASKNQPPQQPQQQQRQQQPQQPPKTPGISDDKAMPPSARFAEMEKKAIAAKKTEVFVRIVNDYVCKAGKTTDKFTESDYEALLNYINTQGKKGTK